MRSIFAIAILAATTVAVLFHGSDAQELMQGHRTERISGTGGDVLEDDPVGKLKVYVYDLPAKYNTEPVEKDPRCLTHMFATEIFVHRSLLSSAVRTLDPEEADWFYTPVYTTCDLTASGHPMPFDSPQMMRSAIRLIADRWPYWNRSEGADHFFVTPHDFGACFHFQEEKAMARGILPLLRRATLVQTFGQRNHVCLKDGSITIPPYAPPWKMEAQLLPPAGNAAVHLRLLPGTLLRRRQRPRGRVLRQGRPRLRVGELQEQPAVRHLHGAPDHLLPGHAARRVLPVPAGLGALEPPPGGGRRVRLHPRGDRRRHRAALRGRHPVGGRRRVRRRGRRPEAGHHPHVHPRGGGAQEAAAPRESGDEARRAVPAAGAAGGRVPPDTQRARTQAPARRRCLLEERTDRTQLDGWPAQRPQAMVVVAFKLPWLHA